ncbi:restriction endonuclease subunit S [Vibrio parahaemolyticus]|uniref:restriction endonuclease subunit S n=3 Tax=Vibrio parahaemolyticus TaxID=670 RepID=UPI00111F42A7|nr:restriction endonuclease subunit S [Vibrio parahaemolyticus]TOM31428.1 type I restriction endonuclease subunit S [Vibrio parahaemolyticus]HCE2440555.1 restriction endonuclease subunit S [Vibrio parahaemolyticus]HCG6309178.1 restriction endonuclease subunit S [Vibrio parahaemolyticus]
MAVDQSPMNKLITEHIDIWTSAVKTRSTSGRGSSKKLELYGVKKLRELILELAVRGKLVPQDPSDEPASVLLERIAEEKKRLVKDKLIPRTKGLPPINEDEIPIDLPNGWTVVRLGELTSKLGSGSTPRGGKNAYTSEGIPFLRSQNVRNEGIKLDDIAYISEEIHQKMENTKVLPGDVLLNITGASLGRSTIFPSNLVEANVSQHVTIIRLIESQMNQFIHLGILSPLVQQLVWGRQVGMAIEGLSKKVLEMFEFPIPPIAEQHRIVAKVDELMALCDQLEQQTEASIEAHQVLVTTLLDTLTNSADADELMQNWARISEHFDTLFTTEESIDQLKQTILQLAVMGKLVPQDPSDEPAAELLKRIAEEKALLVKEKKIKKQKALPPISEDEKPFELPNGWEWCHLNSLISEMDAGWSPACPPEASPNHETWGVLKTTAVQSMEYREYENKVLSPSKEPRPQYEVKNGDILITRAGPKNRVGVSCLVQTTRPKLMISDKIIRFHLIELGMSNNFVSLCLNAGATSEYLESAKSGMAESQMNISQDKLKMAPIPLPPIREQTLIVKKVEELIDLCDKLKLSLEKGKHAHFQFTDSVIEQTV